MTRRNKGTEKGSRIAHNRDGMLTCTFCGATYKQAEKEATCKECRSLEHLLKEEK